MGVRPKEALRGGGICSHMAGPILAHQPAWQDPKNLVPLPPTSSRRREEKGSLSRSPATEILTREQAGWAVCVGQSVQLVGGELQRCEDAITSLLLLPQFLALQSPPSNPLPPVSETAVRTQSSEWPALMCTPAWVRVHTLASSSHVHPLHGGQSLYTCILEFLEASACLRGQPPTPLHGPPIRTLEILQPEPGQGPGTPHWPDFLSQLAGSQLIPPRGLSMGQPP